jgi:sulfate adenylyltransferase subunit 1
VVVAINKMDLVSYSQDVFNNIVIEYTQAAKKLNLKDVQYIPISALDGDNIVDKSNNMNWYDGEPLLSFLENVKIQNDVNLRDARLPIQYVIRPQTPDLHDYRGYAGKIMGGSYKVGDKITVLPSGLESRIKTIETGGKEIPEAHALQSVVIQLEDDIDIGRGDVIVKSDNRPKTSQEFDVMLCWMDNKPLQLGNKYLLQINSRVVRSIVKEIEYKLNVNTLEKQHAPEQIGLNDIIKATIKTASPIAYDSYKNLRMSGSAILVDETSNLTVAACMIQ